MQPEKLELKVELRLLSLQFNLQREFNEIFRLSLPR